MLTGNTDMFSAIQEEMDNINKEEISDEEETLALEEIYSKLEDTKVVLEDLDTNQTGDELSDDDFTKLKDLISSGNEVVEAYRNILPPDLLQRSKTVIQNYGDDLIYNILHSENADEYRAGLDYLIKQLSTIYNGKEISLKELKDMFDTKYN